jgi:RNA polymerase sigma-70 factor (ECF subfamily)
VEAREAMTDRGAGPDQSAFPEEALVRGLRAGDEGVLQRLLDAHWEGVVRYAGGILADSAGGQDVAQEAFVRLWERREAWSVEGSIRGLLYTIARNAALDELRRRGRRAEADGGYTVASTPDPVQDVEAEELRRAADRAIADLPAQRGEVFRLARDAGLTHREIAEVMGLSVQTVSNHMSLALADLRRALRPFLGGPHASEGPKHPP